LGREAMGKAQLDENSVDLRKGRAVSSGLVVAKMQARVGGGGAFMCMVPIGLEVRGRNRWGLRRGAFGGQLRVEINCLVYSSNSGGQTKEPSKIAQAAEKELSMPTQ